MFTKVRWLGVCFTSLWVFLEQHQALAYSCKTCSPTSEEMNLLAATGSEVPDCLRKSPTLSSPGTSSQWEYTKLCELSGNIGAENCTAFGSHVHISP